MHIYKTTCLLNGKIYIGQTIRKKPGYLGSGTIVNAAINIYGKENFICEILCHCATQSALDKMETYFIKKFNATDKTIGYNILNGSPHAFGTPNPATLESVRRKIGDARLGRKVTEEQKKHLSIVRITEGIAVGDKNPNYKHGNRVQTGEQLIRSRELKRLRRLKKLAA